MTRNEAKRLLQDWQSRHDESEAACQAMVAVFKCDYDCNAIDHVWKMFEDYTTVLAELLDATFPDTISVRDSLIWHAYENNFGRNKRSACGGNIKAERPIKNIDDLMKLIGI